VLHLEGRFGGAKQQDQDGREDRGDGARTSGHPNEGNNPGHKKSPPHQARMHKDFYVFIVKIVAKIALVKTGIQVLAIQQGLAFASRHTEGPGMLLMQDMKGRPPHKQPE